MMIMIMTNEYGVRAPVFCGNLNIRFNTHRPTGLLLYKYRIIDILNLA